MTVLYEAGVCSVALSGVIGSKGLNLLSASLSLSLFPAREGTLVKRICNISTILGLQLDTTLLQTGKLSKRPAASHSLTHTHIHIRVVKVKPSCKPEGTIKLDKRWRRRVVLIVEGEGCLKIRRS